MNKSKPPKHLKYNGVKHRLLELSKYVYIIWIISNVLFFSVIELYHHGSVLNIFMNHQLCHLSKHLWVEKWWLCSTCLNVIISTDITGTSSSQSLRSYDYLPCLMSSFLLWEVFTYVIYNLKKIYFYNSLFEIIM